MTVVVKRRTKATPADGQGGLTVIVTVHNEGNLLAKCLESCRRALREALGYYTFSEVVLICDNPDPRSWELANLMVDRELATAVHRTTFGDPGLARNFGAQQAKGEFVTFIDADDLVNHAYLKDFITRIENASGAFLRPRIVLTFGEEKAYLLQYDSKDIPNNETMIYSNPWAMPVFGRRKDFLETPFEADDIKNGFSHEDWEWNLVVLDKGLSFEVVEGAVYFARRRRGSRTIAARNFQYVTKPLSFYRNKVHFDSPRVSDLGMNDQFTASRIGQVDEEDYFSLNPSAMRDMRDGRVHSALDHFLRYGRARGTTIKNLSAQDHIGKFVANATIQSLIRLSDLEGSLDPFGYWAQDVPHYDVFISDRNTYVWRDILDSGIFDKRWDAVFVLPWVRRGGADLVALKHIKACKEMGMSVCIITTLNAPNEWLERMPKDILVLPLGEIAKDVGDIIKLEVFHRLLIELQPKAIHNINSELFWKVLVRNGLSIRSNTRVICSLYCQDYNRAGSSVGYDRYVDVCDPYIDQYVTDNSVYADYLTDSLGVMPTKIVTCRYPIEIGRVNEQKRDFTTRRKTLWASRLDYQKGFDLLRLLAAKVGDVEFHFFGEVMLDSFNINELQMPPNLVYRGKFSHVQEINPDEFDCFLYTARWDGLPNIVLEMGLKGLPVVSFITGGLADVVQDDSAYPVEDVSVDALKAGLGGFYRSKDNGYGKSAAMVASLKKAHDPALFIAQCTELYIGAEGA